MKFSSLLSMGIASTAYAQQGFNIAANKPDGSCKAQADWANNFNVMKSLPGGFTSVRVYASSDCNALQYAVPAAMNTGIKLLAGVWTEDNTHYTNEKNALKAAIQAHGSSWLSGISVGSEDLYRGDTKAATLANQINEIRTMVRGMGYQGPVGHVDTYTTWIKDANAAVIKAVDFVGVDAYPYYQNVSINIAKQTFDQSISLTKNAIQKYKAGTPVWITETGWPVSGPSYGPAVPSVANARAFWENVWCKYPNAVKYFFTLRDYNVAPAGTPSFGVVDINFKPIYSLTC